jgi:hypothetical protein
MRRVFAIPILMCGLALAAACSEGPGTGIPTANGSASASASTSAGRGDLATFVGCIRQHGVNVPDPNPDFAWQQAEQSPGWDAAWSACRHLLPPAPDGEEQAALPSAEELEQYRAFAVCMRAHDIDVSDPDPTGNMVIGGRLANATRAQVEADPGYKAAYGACKDKLPAEGNTK